MTIKTPAVKGMPPLDKPIAGLAIEARLAEEQERRSAEHVAERSEDPARLTASGVYRCTRQTAFQSLGVPKQVEYDLRARMNFSAGDWYHEVTKESLITWLGARCEVDFDHRPAFSLYGRGDAVYDEPIVTAVEIKSKAGYGYNLCTGQKKRAMGPGPEHADLLQGGFFATAPQIQAERVHIVYISKDVHTVAEWVIGLDDPLPHLSADLEKPETIRSLLATEQARLQTVLDDIDAGILAARDVPEWGIVEEVPAHNSGTQRSGDKTLWACSYCSWNGNGLCSLLPSGPVADWVPAFLTDREKAT